MVKRRMAINNKTFKELFKEQYNTYIRMITIPHLRRLTTTDYDCEYTLNEEQFDRHITMNEFKNMTYENMCDLVVSNKKYSYMILNENNEILHVSPGWEIMCGYKSYEVSGKGLRFLQGVDTDRTILKQFEQY